MLAASDWYKTPPSRARSILTFPTMPVALQVTVAGAPAVQLLPPLGEMTVMPLVGVIGKK